MWKVSGVISSVSKTVPDSLEWSEMWVDTQEEAELWWKARTRQICAVRRTHTMFDPDGNVVKVAFT
jgi:hypothetical protein